jgi:cell division protein FtsI (penicillin-binding protein 3)
MIQANRQKPLRRKCLVYVGLLIVLLAAAGGILHRLPLSLQDISRIIQLSASKISPTDTSAAEEKAKPILRGTVYGRNFKELSVSYQLYSLYAQPAEVTDRKKVTDELARLLNTDKGMLLRQLQTTRTTVELANDLDGQQAAEVKALKLEGVYCKAVEVRYYPYHTIGSTVLGFADNKRGLSGVEALYDPVLQPGEFRSANIPEVDFAGKEALGRTTTDIILTIDMDLQKEIELRLNAYRKKKGAARGIAMALEPGSGRVLAMVSQPGYDPNYFWQADSRKVHDLLYTHIYDQNLIRPLLVTAAAIYAAGIEGDVLPPTVSAPDYGFTEEQLRDYWKLFGLEEPVQCKLSLHTIQPDKTRSSETENCDRLSGAQMGVGLATLLNSGSRVTPYYLNSLYDHNQSRFYERAAGFNKRQRLIPPAAGIHLRRELLINSPYSGKDGFLFANSRAGVSVSKKSGFSEYQHQEVVLAAVSRKIPKVLLMMAVDYGCLYPAPPGRKDESGGAGEAETLADLGQRLLPFLTDFAFQDYVAERPVEKNHDNMRRFFISRRLVMPTVKKRFEHVRQIMPELTGMSLRKALQQIRPFNLKVRIKGSGRIVSQEPAPGVSLTEIGVCELTLQSQI